MTRFAILAQSALTGLVMGVVFGALVLGVLVILGAVLPVPAKVVERARVPMIVVCLGVIPLVLTVLGWLEGRAKLQ